MSSCTEIPAKATVDEINEALREHLHSGLCRLDGFATKNDLYLALAETATAERVKQAASDLRASSKAMFGS
jgi:hypothetical protein